MAKSKRNVKTVKKAIVLVLALLLFAGLRMIFLSADAPKDLSWGRGPFTDEGYYAHNARNKILFDTWSMDDYNYHFISPVMAALNYVLFKILGLKYSSMRLGAVFISCLTMLLVFVLARKRYDDFTAMLSVFFMGLAYFNIMYNRLFISEIPMLFFLMITLYFLNQGKKRDYFIAGMSFLLALLSKSLAWHFMAVIAWLLWSQRRDGIWQKAGWFSTGAVSIGIIWFIFVVWPDPGKFFNFYRIYVSRISPQHLSQIYKVFNAEYFAYVPVLTAVALLAVRGYRHFGELDKQAGIWLASGILFLMLFSYTTTAYYLILFIPTVLLACGFIFKIRRQTLDQKPEALWFNAIWLFSAYFISRYIVLFYFRDVFFQSLPAKISLEILTIMCVAGLWQLSRRIASFRQSTILITMLILFLAIDCAPYVTWIAAPHYVVQETMRDLQAKVQSGTVAGPWAPALCLETNLREFPFGDSVVNTSRLRKKTSLTHLLLERREEDLGFIQKNHASLLAHSTIVATYYIDRKIIDLWKLAHD